MAMFLADRTNGRAIGTVLRPSSVVVRRLWRYVLWLNGFRSEYVVSNGQRLQQNSARTQYGSTQQLQQYQVSKCLLTVDHPRTIGTLPWRRPSVSASPKLQLTLTSIHSTMTEEALLLLQCHRDSVSTVTHQTTCSAYLLRQKSLADAQISARQQCVYEGP